MSQTAFVQESSLTLPCTSSLLSSSCVGLCTGDPELEVKVKKACERVSENVHICANEPSLALYRLAEHVRKALPPTVESRVEVRRQHQLLQGAFTDAQYGLDTVEKMGVASESLSNAQDILKNGLLLLQQIKNEQQRRSRREPSMYQRFSAHLNSVEIPDLSELRETARETASRVESVLSRGSSTDSRQQVSLSRTSSVSSNSVTTERTIGRSASLSKKDEQKLGQK